jgi:hypothetical protein
VVETKRLRRREARGSEGKEEDFDYKLQRRFSDLDDECLVLVDI